MGYTHTVYRNNEKDHEKDHDQETWNKFVADCKLLYKNMPEFSSSAGGFYKDSPLLLNGCFKYKNATFNKNEVCFNGSGTTKREKSGKHWVDVLCDTPEHNDLGHETFSIYRKCKGDDGFCKTARKPYDLMVTACLLLYKYYFPTVTISTDGTEDDWSEAYKFIATIFGKGRALELKFQELEAS